MNKKLIQALKIVICLALLIFIIHRIGFNNIITTVKNINILWLIPILIIQFIIIALGAYNIYILIPEVKLKYWKIVKYYILSYSIGLFTPGSIGEFYMVKLLKSNNIETSRSLAILTVDKLITFVTMLLVSVLGIILFFRETISPIIPIIVLLVLIISVMILISKRLEKIIKFIFKKNHEKINSVPIAIKEVIKNQKIIILKNFLLTLIKWIINAVSMKLAFLSFSTNVPIELVLFIMVTARLISLLPITYNGIGVNEAIAVPLYSLYNIAPAPVISVYLIFIILNYLIGFTAVSIYIINKKRIID